jgi:hypothetical protein
MHFFEVIYADGMPPLFEMSYQSIMVHIDPLFLNQELPRPEKVYPQRQHAPWDLPKPGRAGALAGIDSVVLTDDTMTFMVPSWDGNDPANPHNHHPQPLGKPAQYTAKVKFLAWNALKQNTDYTPPQKARILLSYPITAKPQQQPRSDIQLSCTCPSFLYWGYQWLLTQVGAAIADENRVPKIRNPQRRGIVCKHLNRVLHVLPFYLNFLAQEIGKAGTQTHSGTGPTQQQVAPQMPHGQRQPEQPPQEETPPGRTMPGTPGMEPPPIL